MKTGEIVVGAGECTVDYLGVVPRYPERSEAVEIAEFSQQGGGVVATALAALAHFGARTRFVGKVSDDHFGDFIRAGLEGLGVDTTQLVIESDRVSPFRFSAIVPPKGRPTVFEMRGNVSPLTAEEIDLAAALDGASLLIVDATQVDAQLELARAAREVGVHVMLGCGDRTDDVAPLLPVVDTLIVSERTAADIAPASELDRTLRELRKLGPRRCLVTLGPEGAFGIDDGDVVHEEPAYRVEVRDTTGAGDVYLGAAAYALLKGWPLTQLMRFASIAASMTCRELGARAAIPRLAEVLDALGADLA